MIIFINNLGSRTGLFYVKAKVSLEVRTVRYMGAFNNIKWLREIHSLRLHILCTKSSFYRKLSNLTVSNFYLDFQKVFAS